MQHSLLPLGLSPSIVDGNDHARHPTVNVSGDDVCTQ
jgi:hypothetical protein